MSGLIGNSWIVISRVLFMCCDMLFWWKYMKEIRPHTDR